MQKISTKFYRLKTSKNYLKLIQAFHKIFKNVSKKEILLPSIYDSTIHRKHIINDIIRKKNYNSYLEIGCDQNELFTEVEIKNKIGVDPNNGGTHRMTSDHFFKNNDNKFDIIFIDGLHIYSQVRKDIINSIKCLKDHGIILLHDCFPLTYFDQAIPRAQRKWNGDVWKAIVEARTLTDIDTYTSVYDNGIGLIVKRKNSNILKISSKNFKNIKYEEYFENYSNYLNLIDLEKFFKVIDEI